MIYINRFPVVISTFLLLSALIPGSPFPALAQSSVESYDGSFRLETGEVITGGYFVEGGQGYYLYMDTQGLARGGLFERIDEIRLRSVSPPGVIEIEFSARDENGMYREVEWREEGESPINGRRIHPHETEAVNFVSDDGTRLEGRLLLPACPGPHPVVVSVHGSGPVNRYGGTFNTVFLQHGVAVLAYDKRGYTSDPGMWSEPDLSELSSDAAAAVAFASRHPQIDSGRIGIFGSSQGGWVVPPAAVEAPDADFIILRAGAAISEMETLLHEVRQELRNEGMSGMELDYAMYLRREIYRLAIEGRPLAAADSLAAPYMEEPWYKVAIGNGPVSTIWSPEWWSWAQRNLAVSSTSALEQYDGPVLWFLGEKDENVPLVSTRAALERSFAESNGDDQEIVVLEDALHSFFIEGTTPPEYSDGFFSYMAEWMAERGFTGAPCPERE